MSRLLDHDIGLVVTTPEAPNLAGIADGPGVLTKANCPAINALLPLMPTASGSFMYTGGHTVVTANVYADASRTGQPIWTGYYGTSPLGSVGPAQDANPLFDSVTGGGRFADAWNAGTGELVIWDTLDWLDTTGGCVRCDLSGYTVQNTTLKDANHGLRSATATGTTFKNVTFGPAYDLTSADLGKAIFQGVTMPAAPIFAEASLANATFIGTNTIAAPVMTGTNLNGINLSSSTSITNVVTGGTPPICTNAANADLTRGTFTVATVSAACGVSPLFAGSQVRPTIVPLAEWRIVDWSQAAVIFEVKTRSALAGANLAGVRMKGSTFWGVPADLSNANLSHATLDGASFVNASFVGANLQGVSAVDTTFLGGDLSNADLTQPTGMKTTLDGAVLSYTILNGTQFGGSSLVNADFTAARARHGTDFTSANAAGATFDKAHVLGNATAFKSTLFANPVDGSNPASFSDAVMGGDKNADTALSFKGAYLPGVSFSDAQCIGCDFSGANISNADFGGAWLNGASFDGTATDSTNFGSSVISSTGGVWKYSFGTQEGASDGYAVNYDLTNFGGTTLTSAATCPDGYKPAKGKGCAEHLYFYPVPTPGCAASGLDTCSTPVLTLAGTTSAGSGTNQLREPQAVVVAKDGVYIADAANHVVRFYTSPGNGTTIAGTGDEDDGPDGGDATQSPLDAPVGLALAADGTTLYIADRDANRIRKVTRSLDANGKLKYTIWGVAGDGTWCQDLTGTCGDGGTRSPRSSAAPRRSGSIPSGTCTSRTPATTASASSSPAAASGRSTPAPSTSPPASQATSSATCSSRTPAGTPCCGSRRTGRWRRSWARATRRTTGRTTSGPPSRAPRSTSTAREAW